MVDVILLSCRLIRRLVVLQITQQINYIRNVGDNIKELERKMNELASLEKDVRNRVTRAEWVAKKPREVVNNWLNNVEEMKDEVSEINQKIEKNGRCLVGCLPNCSSLRKIGKRTLKLIKEVSDLYIKGSFEVTTLVGSNAERNFNLIWDLLMEENCGIIGIYGMGGVGKTAIMKNISNQLASTKKFDIVIWVIVSKDFNLKRLQCAIADRLKLNKDLDEKSLSIQLHEALRGKKFLLVLDDVWNRISLEQVGIPKPSVGNGCKVVLTTRSLRVCQSMETNKFIKIKELSEEEAWLLFEEKVEATALVDSDVEVVAKQVANECKGLPLALITVGRALRGVSDVGRWKHALRQLKNSEPEVGDMEYGVFTKLHFSYQYLKSDKLRACFLYCSLFPEDYIINENILIELWICEGFIEEQGDKQAMLDEGQSTLNELVEACMLERSSRYYVEMHDLMRDMAIGITRKSPIFMVKAGIGLEKVVADKEWAEDVERISLMRNRIEMLSGEPPKCPKLLTLFLNENPISHFESPSFFQHMNQLRVLDLSETNIEELPESISSLENLHMLMLYNCTKLKTIPSLAKLKELRLLNVGSTEIQELPVSFSNLENLRELHAFACKKLNTIPSLAKLKELRLLDLSYTGIQELPESLSDLENLHELKVMYCEKLNTIPSLAKLKELRLLEISSSGIQELPVSFSDLENLRQLHAFACKKLNTIPSLAKLKELRLLDVSYTGIQELPPSFLELVNLRELLAHGCRNLNTIPSLAKLKELRTLDLTSSGIEVLPESLSGLEKLNVLGLGGCEKLKSVPCLAKLKNLTALLLVGSCIEEPPQEREEFVQQSAEEPMTYFEIKKCRGIELLLGGRDYYNYSARHPLRLSQVSILELADMPDLRALHKGIRLHGTLANLRKLIIRGCHKLKNLFSVGMLQTLQNLKEVEIMDCSAMKEVVAGEEDEKTLSNTLITLPNLNSIELFHLRALKSICSRTMVCSSLTTIEIISCCRLKKIPLIIYNPPPGGFMAKLRGTKEWWDALDWADLAHTKDLLKSFFIEEIEA